MQHRLELAGILLRTNTAAKLEVAAENKSGQRLYGAVMVVDTETHISRGLHDNVGLIVNSDVGLGGWLRRLRWT